MAEDFLQVPPDSTGTKMRTVSQTIGANAVEQETVVIGDATTARVAGVTAAGELNVAGTVVVNDDTMSLLQTILNQTLDYHFQTPWPVSTDPSSHIQVDNFPTTQPVSGEVSLDSGTLTALENTTVNGEVSVSNFPVTQPVSVASLDAETITQLSQALESILISISGTVNLDQNVTDAIYQIGTLANHQISGDQVTQVSNFPTTQPVSGTITVANPTTNPETGLAKDATLTSLGSTLGTDASLQSILTAITNAATVAATAAAQAATTAAVEAMGTAIDHQNEMNPPRVLQYSRVPTDDSMRVTVQNAVPVTVSSGSLNVGTLGTIGWGNNNVYAPWYATGAPMAMDAREAQRELSQQTFYQVRAARWVIT